VTEMERRLRAAMCAAVADEQPPANLLQRIRARRKRHRATAAVACVAVAAAGALLISPAGSGLRGGLAPARPPASVPAPRAARGTVLESCSRQIDVLNGTDRGQSIRVGPLLLVGLRQDVGIQPDRGFGIGGLEVAIRDNTWARVSVAGPARLYFRFLFGRSDFTNGVDGRYTIKDGESGVMFAGCASDASDNSPPGYTLYGGYFLVSKPPRCVSLDVWTAASDRPARITFAAGRAVCGSRR
jgi:hypothetical protein